MAIQFYSKHDFYSYKGLQIYLKGEIYINGQWFRTAEEVNSGIIEKFISYKQFTEIFIGRLLPGSSGFFSLVIQENNEFLIASDIIRYYPLFYGYRDNSVFVSDEIEKYQREFGYFRLDNSCLEEYIASGFTYGKNTVYKGVYGIQAGEAILIKGEKINSYRYFEFKPIENLVKYVNINDFSNLLNKTFGSVFQRMLEQSPDVKRWIIPLSGGHDSRMIVNYLYRLGIKNVICFSYGTKNNEQSAISKLVAESLGYEWHFVEYTEEKWQAMHKNGMIDEYVKFSFNGVSTPHLQDFLAVYELNEKGIITAGDFFIPGHALDFIAGSHLIDSDITCNDPVNAINRITEKFASRAKGKTIRDIIEEIFNKSNQNPSHFQEYFNWQERQAKFIVNSIRVYEFFGFDSRLPFWDRELVDFWLMVPAKERVGRKIFREAEKNGILVNELINIPFAGEGHKKIRLEDHISSFFSLPVRNAILRFTGMKRTLNEGLNQIYSLEARSVRDLLDPVEDFHENLRPYFIDYLKRYTWQMDYHFLTSLYTIRKILDHYKKD